MPLLRAHALTPLLNCAVQLATEGNALCAIGAAFQFSQWPLSTVCASASPISDSSIPYNASKVPVWCSWPYVGCDRKTYSVISIGLLDYYSGPATSVPSAFASLSSLQRLQLRNARLTGTIPSSLTALTRLTFLDLAYNALSGSIPAIPIVPMHVDNAVDFRNNRLVGPVPSTITNLKYTYLGRYDNLVENNVDCPLIYFHSQYLPVNVIAPAVRTPYMATAS